MSTVASIPRPSGALTAHQREALRLAISYFLGCADRLTRLLGHDLDTSVVFAALVWENVQDTTLPLRGEAAADAALRIQARRPVSVYRLSQVLGMPYETTRRHVGRLLDAGLCVRHGSGIIAPKMARPQSTRVARRTLEVTRDLLRSLGVLGLRSPAARALSTFEVEWRVARLTLRYFLQSLQTITASLGVDMLTALMFLAVNRHNFQGELPASGARDILPDERRQPISTYLLAQQLRLPYETARRHVGKLSQAKLVVRTPAGLIVPADVLTRPALADAGRRAWCVTLDFLCGLADVGLLIPDIPLSQAALVLEPPSGAGALGGL